MSEWRYRIHVPGHTDKFASARTSDTAATLAVQFANETGEAAIVILSDGRKVKVPPASDGATVKEEIDALEDALPEGG